MNYLRPRGHEMCYRRAETLVAQLFVRGQWQVLARNWRRRGCELDLVVLKDRQLVIVEVKYRRTFTPTASALHMLLGSRKRHALQRGAQRFVVEHQLDHIDTIRFDLVVVASKVPATISCLHYGPLKLFYYRHVVE